MTFRHLDAARTGKFEKTGEFFKVEDGVAYGWAIVSTEKGSPYWDLQDDHIPEDEMVAAAIDFMKSQRVGSDQHTGEHVGDIVFGFPVTKASNTLGLVSEKTGFLIGYQPQDPVHLDMIAGGERTGFSIGGLLLDYEVSDVGKGVWSTAMQNNLPDSAFLYVKDGGKKDADGKTTPRSLRMFPVKGADGKVDMPHLNNALARIPQSTLSSTLKASLASKGEKLKGALKSLAKGSPDPGDVYTPSDISDGKPKPKRGKVYRRFKIDEISLVTRPAQEGATVGYVKGATISRAAKQAIITSEEDGHQHVVDLDDADENGCGCTSYARSGGDDYGHSHDFIVDAAAGTVTIAANAGHGHTADVPERAPGADLVPAAVEQVTLAAPTSAPARAGSLTPKATPASVVAQPKLDTEKNTMTDLEIAALTKKTERAEKMATLTDAHRSFAKSLGESDLESFLGKGAADRETVLKAAIEFTAADGTVYYKHDDARQIVLAKKNDELSKSVVLEQSLRKTAEFAKAASEDMGGYPETDAVHAAIIEAVESIKDEPTRKSARACIVAGNAAFKKASRMTGTTGAHDKQPGGVETELAKAEGALKKSVEDFQKAKNIGSYAEAFAEATGSDPVIREAYGTVAQLRRESQN